MPDPEKPHPIHPKHPLWDGWADGMEQIMLECKGTSDAMAGFPARLRTEDAIIHLKEPKIAGLFQSR